jgi:hypothetical protein
LGEKKSVDQYLIKLNNMRRWKEEALATFYKRFHSFYCSMPLDIRPFETAAMVYYTLAQHHESFLYLRERKSSSLEQMFTNAKEIEENFQARGRLPKQFWDESFEQSKAYEQHKSDLDADQIKEGYGQQDVYEQKLDLGHFSASFSDFNSFLGLKLFFLLMRMLMYMIITYTNKVNLQTQLTIFLVMSQELIVFMRMIMRVIFQRIIFFVESF